MSVIDIQPGTSREFFALIRAVGESKTRQEEVRLAEAEKINLIQKFKDPSLSHAQLKELLVRAVYCEMLGVAVEPAHFHACTMTQATNLLHKKTGYVTAALFLRPSSELSLLIVSSILKDLASPNHLEICVALTAVPKLTTAEMIPQLVAPICALVPSHESPLVRKKAVAALHHFVLIAPDSLEQDMELFRMALCDQNPSVMGVTLNVFETLIVADARAHKDLTPSFVSILKQVVEGRLPLSYAHHSVHAPWIQMRLLRLLALLGADDQKASEGIYEVLRLTLASHGDGIGACYAIVFECVRTATKIYPNTVILQLAANAIKQFFASNNHSLRYMGVAALAEIVKVNPKVAAEHQGDVMRCLEDRDDTLRRRTFDLLYRMINRKNAVAIVDKLLVALMSTLDPRLRADLVDKITTAAEKHAPDTMWYLKTVTAVYETGGKLVSPSVGHTVMRLIGEGMGGSEEADAVLRRQATLMYLGLFDRAHLPDGLMQVAVWVVGEYAYLIEDSVPMDTVVARLCELMAAHYEEPATRVWILAAITKLCAQLMGLPPIAEEVARAHLASKNIELAQRAKELLALKAVSPAVLEVVLPIDASAEDVLVDSQLSFLNPFLNAALRAGAKSYASDAERRAWKKGRTARREGARRTASSTKGSSASSLKYFYDKSKEAAGAAAGGAVQSGPGVGGGKAGAWTLDGNSSGLGNDENDQDDGLMVPPDMDGDDGGGAGAGGGGVLGSGGSQQEGQGQGRSGPGIVARSEGVGLFAGLDDEEVSPMARLPPATSLAPLPSGRAVVVGRPLSVNGMNSPFAGSVGAGGGPGLSGSGGVSAAGVGSSGGGSGGGGGLTGAAGSGRGGLALGGVGGGLGGKKALWTTSGFVGGDLDGSSEGTAAAISGGGASGSSAQSASGLSSHYSAGERRSERLSSKYGEIAVTATPAQGGARGGTPPSIPFVPLVATPSGTTANTLDSGGIFGGLDGTQAQASSSSTTTTTTPSTMRYQPQGPSAPFAPLASVGAIGGAGGAGSGMSLGLGLGVGGPGGGGGGGGEFGGGLGDGSGSAAKTSAERREERRRAAEARLKAAQAGGSSGFPASSVGSLNGSDGDGGRGGLALSSSAGPGGSSMSVSVPPYGVGSRGGSTALTDLSSLLPIGAGGGSGSGSGSGSGGGGGGGGGGVSIMTGPFDGPQRGGAFGGGSVVPLSSSGGGATSAGSVIDIMSLYSLGGGPGPAHEGGGSAGSGLIGAAAGMGGTLSGSAPAQPVFAGAVSLLDVAKSAASGPPRVSPEALNRRGGLPASLDEVIARVGRRSVAGFDEVAADGNVSVFSLTVCGEDELAFVFAVASGCEGGLSDARLVLDPPSYLNVLSYQVFYHGSEGSHGEEAATSGQASFNVSSGGVPTCVWVRTAVTGNLRATNAVSGRLLYRSPTTGTSVALVLQHDVAFGDFLRPLPLTLEAFGVGWASLTKDHAVSVAASTGTTLERVADTLTLLASLVQIINKEAIFSARLITGDSVLFHVTLSPSGQRLDFAVKAPSSVLAKAACSTCQEIFSRY